MTEHEQNRHLDKLLDSALSAYSAVEPGPGLETRILANLREAESRKASRPWRFKWMWAGAAVAAVAAAILMLVLPRVSHRPYTAPQSNIAHTQAPAQPVASPDNSLAHTQPAPPLITVQQRPSADGSSLRHGRQRSAAIPVENAALPINQRPAVFPSPSPLTEQEKLLLSYYARTPREELVAQSHPDEPPAIGDDESRIAVPDLISVPQKSSNTR
jgi:uncharacterized membrane protein YdfJ with MMPL/SSD domain